MGDSRNDGSINDHLELAGVRVGENASQDGESVSEEVEGLFDALSGPDTQTQSTGGSFGVVDNVTSDGTGRKMSLDKVVERATATV